MFSEVSMIISVPKELKNCETRVALTPDMVKKYKSIGFSVCIESGAGILSGFNDEAYANVGATILRSPEEIYNSGNILLKIWAPLPQEFSFLHPKQTLLANCQNLMELNALAERKITCFALNLLPRISRAQSMDILSSQSNLSGYYAVVQAINLLPRAVPLMMTAAGTVSPARVLVLGVGVAGLQAIATAKRLGAIVYASDVRSQVKEQVESLGAKFLQIDSNDNFETSSGYAAETSESYQEKQNFAVMEQLKKTDILITTALIAGKKAPLLVTKKMLDNMPCGSVVIDMASENGGNVEGSQDNLVIDYKGIKILGNSNLAAKVPYSSSTLFANNLYNFIASQYSTEKQNIIFNFEDELIRKTCLIKEGEIL